MKKLYSAAVIAAMLIATSASNSFAQNELEFSSGSYSSPSNGATVANQVVSFYENTSGSNFSAYAPAITATFSLSNQQFNSVPGIATNKGMTFGATASNSSKNAANATVFQRMENIASPSSSSYTSNPNGTAGSGLSVSTNYGVWMFTNTEGLYAGGTSAYPLNGRFYYGDLTITFSRPVSNPVVHVVGLGGSVSNQGFTTELELQTAGVTASKLSGSSDLGVTNNKIVNNENNFDASCGDGAVCGSIKMAGTNITSLTFKVYVKGDGEGSSWSNSGDFAGDAFIVGVSMAKPASVSGNVYNDVNGLTNNNINGSGTNCGGPLYMALVDASDKVVTTTAVAANGSYTFEAVSAGSYKVVLMNVNAANGTTCTTACLPAGWAIAGEGTTAAGDGTPDGKFSVTVGTTGINAVNFGIQRPPAANPVSHNITYPVYNSSKVLNVAGGAVNPLSGTDPDDGGLGTGNTFKIVSIANMNGNQLYYNNVLVAGNTTITNYDPALLSVKFTGVGSYSASFTYAAVDAAGAQSTTPAAYTLTWNSPLPVKLISFDGHYANNRTELAWEVAEETDMEGYTVERSIDGIRFESIAEANATGNDYYSAIDENPATGINYYRLKMTDLDGDVNYSGMVKIAVTKTNTASITLYPNPVTDRLNLVATDNGGTVMVADISGRVWKTFTAANGNNEIDMSSLPAGIYIVNYNNGSASESHKIIKK